MSVASRLETGNLRSKPNSDKGPIVIFGGTGFLGKELARTLIAQGREVHVFGRFIEGRELVGEPSLLSEVLQNFNNATVFFVIGNTKTAPKGLADHETRQFASSVLSARKELLNARQILQIGSSEEYGFSETPFRETDHPRPLGNYGQAKLFESSIFSSIRADGGPVTILRPTSVFGLRQNESTFVGQVLKSIREGTELILEHPFARRDYLYVKDFVSAVEMCIRSERLPLVLNIGSTEVLSRLDFVRVAEGLSGVSVVTKFEKRPSAVVLDNLVDIDLINLSLGWLPSWTIEAGISDMLRANEI